ncbi:protein BTG4 [Oenanthe melanoleuca]|uniref:protein BTG4 n=1 Tax=Oenanthe melanoleuca TaxID=2939378 RepID=UPI0024C11EB4|nr:protein BTG4 [Oenanthe melanoleuca]
MKDEIAAAVFFITKLVKREGKLSKDGIEKFAEKLTTILFEKYKNHWYPGNPCRGQAFRCIRINKQQPREPLLEQACVDTGLDPSLLGLPREVTVWVDPLEVSCRYGERNQPFTVARFDGRENPELPQHISLAVAKAALDYDSGTSSDEESFSREPKAIPTVSNPNSIYQVSSGGTCSPEIPPKGAPPLPWWQYQHRKPHLAEGSHFGQHRGYRGYGPGATPCGDRYHWINPKK